jgi:hypothetical protein
MRSRTPGDGPLRVGVLRFDVIRREYCVFLWWWTGDDPHVLVCYTSFGRTGWPLELVRLADLEGPIHGRFQRCLGREALKVYPQLGVRDSTTDELVPPPDNAADARYEIVEWAQRRRDSVQGLPALEAVRQWLESRAA